MNVAPWVPGERRRPGQAGGREEASGCRALPRRAISASASTISVSRPSFASVPSRWRRAASKAGAGLAQNGLRGGGAREGPPNDRIDGELAPHHPAEPLEIVEGGGEQHALVRPPGGAVAHDPGRAAARHEGPGDLLERPAPVVLRQLEGMIAEQRHGPFPLD